jgi:hypothetical protein
MRSTALCIALFGLVVTACGPGQMFGPTVTTASGVTSSFDYFGKPNKAYLALFYIRYRA